MATTGWAEQVCADIGRLRPPERSERFRPKVPKRIRTIAASRPCAGQLERTTMKVLVCGGRDLQDAELVESTLERLRAARGPFDCLILGGARGVDRIAGKWARKNGVLEWDFLPEWHRAGKHDGRRAQSAHDCRGPS